MPDARHPQATAQAVVFDIGRVLYEWDLRHLYRKLIADPDELEWFVGTVVTPEWHFQSDAGRPLTDMVPELRARFPEHGELIDAYEPRFLETLPHPVPGTHQLVERLAARGVPLFALTNFGAEFFARFRPTAPIFRHFRDIVVSGDEKCAKPEPRIYEIAERRFGYAPEALFFTDDSPANVAAAKARGWQAHLFTDAANLEAALNARSLLE